MLKPDSVTGVYGAAEPKLFLEFSRPICAGLLALRAWHGTGKPESCKGRCQNRDGRCPRDVGSKIVGYSAKRAKPHRITDGVWICESRFVLCVDAPPDDTSEAE